MRTLIKNGTIFTQNAEREILQRTDLLIECSRISAIGSQLSIEADHIINAEGMWIVPGLINSHVHLGESAYASWMSGRYGLSGYLERTEELAQKLGLENERPVIAAYSLLQLIRQGTTTIAGGRTHEHAGLFGIRNVSGYMLMKSRKLGHFSKDFSNEMTLLSAENKFEGSFPAIFIHSLDTTDASLLREVSLLSDKNPEMRIMIHMSETAHTVQRIKERYGKREIDVLNEFGLLGRQTLLVHGNHLSDDDLSKIANKGSSLAHCLSSNLNTADKTLQVDSALKRGVNVTLATDGVVTGSDFSVLREAGIAYRYHNRFLQTGGIPAQLFFDMVTINAASALGLQESVGSIEIGKDADLVIMTPPMGLVRGSIEHLLHYSNLTCVRDVMVAGNWIFKAGKSTKKNSRHIEREFFKLVNQDEPEN
jgi:5-methylthioadenosine/S-adenosylhomocysteine deaminase